MNYGKIVYGEDIAGRPAWVVEGIPPHVAIRLKQIFPRIPKTDVGPFLFKPDNSTANDLVWFMERYPLEASGVDRAMLAAGQRVYRARQAEIERILTPDYLPRSYVGVREGMEVRQYQSQAVEVLMRAMGLLLGDEVGLGKTFTAAAAFLQPGTLPGVVVCQPHLQRQWAKVLRRFTNLIVHEIKGTKPYRLPPADVYIYRYTQLVGWVDTFRSMGIKLLVYDEVQELRTGVGTEKEPIAKGVAARRLSRNSVYRLGLTATPIYNYGIEIWNVMQFIRPEVLGSKDDFLREWTSGGHVTDPKALGTYLREEHAFLRRTKADVGQMMPPINRIIESIDYDAATVRSAEELAHKLAIKATTGAPMERGQAARDLDLKLRQQTGIAKARQVADFARIIVEGGTPIVLVGWHREVYAIWNKALEDLKPAMFTGSETQKQKDDGKERFLNGETDILIMSLRSGAGLDGLQFRCSTMIFGELDWSPGIHHQCLGRLDREHQKEPVTGFFLTVPKGSDPPMMEVLGLKAAEASAIIDPTLGVQATHTDVGHLQTLVQRYLSRSGAAA